MIDRSSSVFSRSSAVRVRPPRISGPRSGTTPASGRNVRSAARPTKAAAKMIRLRRMMPAGVCPRDMKTTIVAPIRPASVNNCHGCSASGCSGELETLD
ncbi:hypothetical protein D3C83_14870 [compost metagenome]